MKRGTKLTLPIVIANELCGAPARHGAPCGLDKQHAQRGERHSNGRFTWALRGKADPAFAPTKKAKDMKKSKSAAKAANNEPHEAGCACGPCHNDREKERAMAKPKKLPAGACGVLDGSRGRACIQAKGHEGHHFTGMRNFRDAAPPAPKKKPAKAAAKLTDRCGKCDREMGEHDGKKCPTVEHDWEKTNLITQSSGRGPMYDTYRCTACGATSKRIGVAWPPKLDAKQPKSCKAKAAPVAPHRPLTLEDEPEDAEGDEAALEAMRQYEEQNRKIYDQALESLDLDECELAELREMERSAEERLDGELETSDLRTVLEQFRMKLCKRPGRRAENGKRDPDAAPSKITDIETGRSSGLKHPLARLFGYRRHAAGALWSFADLEGDELGKLVANLKQRDADARAAGLEGQALISPVVLVEDRAETGMLEWFVLDGWNRLRACDAAGVRPRFVNYSGRTDIDTLLDYVDAVNDKRRHITAGQRAAIDAEADGLRQGQRADGNTKTQAERAAAGGYSDRLLRRAKKVKDNVTPKTWEAVKRGKIAPDAALEAIGLPNAKQDELADRALAGNAEMKAGKYRALARHEKKREVVQRTNSGLVAPMPMGPFGLIVVDYAWLYENSDGHEGSRGHTPYPGMPWPDILAHAAEATRRAADDCVLGLWVTNAFLLKLGAVIDAWGFVDMEAPITWNKVHVGMGIRGPRHQTEHLVLASKGNPTTTLNEMTTLFEEPSVRGGGGHSKKPDRLYELLAKHCAGPRLELFAVGQREGWQCWGNEADKPIATPRKSKILTATDAAMGAA